MYLITYAGRTVIHDGSVEFGAAAARQNETVKSSNGHVIKEDQDSEHDDGGRQGTDRPNRAEVLARLQAQPLRKLKRSGAEIIRAERGA